MRCSKLMIPGSEAPRFYVSTITSTTPKSDPIHRFRPVTRISMASFKTKAAVNAGVATGMSFYELLGIPESVTLPEIKQAYKQLARKYHPDVSPPDQVEEYTQRFIRVQEAYETLSDPSRRALYDRDMAKSLHLALSVRRRYHYQNEEMETRSEWKNNWQSQLSELKRRSMNKDSGSVSWGAGMRRQREGLSEEL